MNSTGSTNPEFRRVVTGLKKLKKYDDLVRQLEKPRRKKIGVNLVEIEKSNAYKVASSEVLGNGELKKPLIVYAWHFSKSAREKIEKAGGKALSFDDLIRNKDDVVVL